MEKYKDYLLIISIFLLIVLTAILTSNKQEDYIQNLEEKLNIYERSYEEFCLEDSLKQ